MVLHPAYCQAHITSHLMESPQRSAQAAKKSWKCLISYVLLLVYAAVDVWVIKNDDFS